MACVFIRMAAAVSLALLLLAFALVGSITAAPLGFEASFRDLPATVRAGDLLTVVVDTASGTTCQGTITYRGGAVQTLDSVTEIEHRCRWDVTVPSEARRGTADIRVTLSEDTEQETIEASVDVLSRGDEIDAAFRRLPGVARRGEQIPIVLDVSEGATCQGSLTLDDGRVQALDPQRENRQRCRWDITVAGDAPYGPAKLRVSVTQGSGQATLTGSFEVGRRSDDASLLVGIRDLVTTVRRDGAFGVRALVPSEATCSGTVVYRRASQVLEERKESAGECSWTVHVPADAGGGIAEVSIKIQKGSESTTTLADLSVVRDATDLDVSFKDVPDSIRRGQTLEIRVGTPDGATCDGTLTYWDAAPQPLGAQVERRERCYWEVAVPTSAPRGTATIRITVTNGTDATTIVRTVEILSRDGN
jgi:hypothetical protein